MKAAKKWQHRLHTAEKCTEALCGWCESGQLICVRCGGFGEYLPTECPRAPMSLRDMVPVSLGQRDFRAGRWLSACSIWSPSYVFTQTGDEELHAWIDGIRVTPELPRQVADDCPFLSLGGAGRFRGNSPEQLFVCENLPRRSQKNFGPKLRRTWQVQDFKN